VAVNPQTWETFRAVAEVGSITGAARVLNLSQSAVSQQVQQLEEFYGVRLLVRHAQGVQLTAAGEVLYRYVGKLLRTLDETRDQIHALADPHPERLTVGASFTIAEYVLPDLLTRFYRPVPKDYLSVMMANSEAVLDFVIHQAVDIGLVETEVRRPEVITRRFYTDTPMVIVGAQHPWADRRHISLEELLAEPIILREPGSGTRAALERALNDQGLGVEDLSVRLILGTTQAIKAMVRSGLGCTVLSPLTILPAEREEFHLLSVDGLVLTRYFYAVHLPRPLNVGARRLLALLAQDPVSRTPIADRPVP
jgi:DNA-binding transcriptional LysR family regulator